MTKPIITEVTCPNCKAEGYFTMFLSINATLLPELQKEMENGKLLIWECPKCGKKYICYYPFVYHDMEKGIMQCQSINIPEDKLEELGLSGIIELNW